MDGVGARTVRVEHAEPAGRFVAMKLSGVDTPEAAEALRGATLRIPAAAVQPLPPGQFYVFQIVGLRVRTPDGAPLGEVADVLRTGANDVYVVRSSAGREIAAAGHRGRDRDDRPVGGRDRRPSAGVAVMRVDVVTIFPEVFPGPLSVGVMGRARDRGLLDLVVWDLRTFTEDRHRSVDDLPYGGGVGMVMKPEPFGRALDAIRAARPDDRSPGCS